MNRIEVSMWEMENKENIVGWEIHYGFEKKCKGGACRIEEEGWKWFGDHVLIIYKMKDKTTHEFKIMNNETVFG